MTGREPIPAGVDEILGLFQGRRRSQRIECRRPIDVAGRDVSYRGQTLDVSRLGALIAINDESFLPADGIASLMDVAEIVRGIFPHSMTIVFRRAEVRVAARVVRVAQHPKRLGAVLGCEFATPLTRRQCRAIGIVPDTKGEVADAGRPRGLGVVSMLARRSRTDRTKR